MLSLKILPYKMASEGATELAKALDCPRIRINSPTFKSKPSHLLVNWGNYRQPAWRVVSRILNIPGAVGVARNKWATLLTCRVHDISVPDFTRDMGEAQKWVDQGKIVIARETLTGQGGAGIVIYRDGAVVGDAPLYTKHIRHKDEYRVHVVNGKVIHVQQKRKNGGEQANPLIRNHNQGWVFCQEGFNCPEKVKIIAVGAVRALGLDFGAVDVAYRVKESQPYVLEVNTAPGLEGTTITKYAEALKEYLQ